MVVAVIPARGGSKRLPGKNLRVFAGRPLIAYSIDLARNVPDIDRCVVSTDDEQIAEVARSCGAEVLRRPARLSTDHATTGSAIQDALSQLATAGRCPSIVVTLQPTNPLRTVALVEQGLALFRDVRPDSVVSVAPTSIKTGAVRDGMFLPDYVPGCRSQDMPERFYETGLLYVTDARLVLDQGELFGIRMAALPTDPRFAGADIDTIDDFESAEALYLSHRHHFSYVDAARAETPDA